MFYAFFTENSSKMLPGFAVESLFNLLDKLHHRPEYEGNVLWIRFADEPLVTDGLSVFLQKKEIQIYLKICIDRRHEAYGILSTV